MLHGREAAAEQVKVCRHSPCKASFRAVRGPNHGSQMPMGGGVPLQCSLNPACFFRFTSASAHHSSPEGALKHNWRDGTEVIELLCVCVCEWRYQCRNAVCSPYSVSGDGAALGSDAELHQNGWWGWQHLLSSRSCSLCFVSRSSFSLSLLFCTCKDTLSYVLAVEGRLYTIRLKQQ